MNKERRKKGKSLSNNKKRRKTGASLMFWRLLCGLGSNDLSLGGGRGVEEEDVAVEDVVVADDSVMEGVLWEMKWRKSSREKKKHWENGKH